MAIKSPSPTQYTITANGNTTLGGGGGAMNGLLVGIDADGSFNGSITFQGRVKDSGGAWTSLAYFDTSAGAYASAAITADAMVIVLTTGMEVRLVTAGMSAGQADVYVRPVLAP